MGSQSCHGGRDEGYAWAQQHNFHSPRPNWLQPLLSVQSASSRDQRWGPAPFPGMTGQLPGGRLTTLDCFHHGRDSALFLLCTRTWICFPCMYCFCRLLQCLIHHHGIPHSTASNQGIHSKWSAVIRSCSQTLPDLPCCPPSWSCWLDGWMAFWRPSYRCN